MASMALTPVEPRTKGSVEPEGRDSQRCGSVVTIRTHVRCWSSGSCPWPQPRPPLRAFVRAARRPCPGRLDGPREGDRPLRPRARKRVRLVRGPDDPRRARRYFRDCCWDVHVPRGAQERALKLEEAQTRLTVDLRRAPTVAEIAQYLEIDVEQALDAMQASQAYGVVVARGAARRLAGRRRRARVLRRLAGRDRRALRAGRGRRHDCGRVEPSAGARASRARAALRRGPHAVRDRGPHRRVADARLAPAPSRRRAAADPGPRSRRHRRRPPPSTDRAMAPPSHRPGASPRRRASHRLDGRSMPGTRRAPAAATVPADDRARP